MENSDIHLCRENGDLGELPSELQYKIAQGFSAPDLARLAQVSTALRDVAKGTPGYFSQFYLEETLKEHSDRVVALASDQDTKTLFSGSADQTIKVWTPDGSGNYDASRTQTLSGHSDWVIALAYDQATKTLFSASEDKTVKVWTTRK